MNITDIITYIGDELDTPSTSTLTNHIKLGIQHAIYRLYGAIGWHKMERTSTLTTTANTRTLSLPEDFGFSLNLVPSTGDSSSKRLRLLPPSDFFNIYPAKQQTGTPKEYCIWNNQIYLSPTPDAAIGYDMVYRQAVPNIWQHTLTIADDDNAATTGVQIYVDEDAVATGEGSLYFVSPTDTDALLRIQTLDGHWHEFTVTDSDVAAAIGKPLFFDEDGTDKLLFVSPTNTDTVIKSNVKNGHYHWLQITDNDNAASSGVNVYFDEDAAVKTERLLFVSPTDTNGSVDSMVSSDNQLPPLWEQHHHVIYLFALANVKRYLKEYDEAKAVLEMAKDALNNSVISNTLYDGRDIITATAGEGQGQ